MIDSGRGGNGGSGGEQCGSDGDKTLNWMRLRMRMRNNTDDNDERASFLALFRFLSHFHFHACSCSRSRSPLLLRLGQGRLAHRGTHERFPSSPCQNTWNTWCSRKLPCFASLSSARAQVPVELRQGTANPPGAVADCSYNTRGKGLMDMDMDTTYGTWAVWVCLKVHM